MSIKSPCSEYQCQNINTPHCECALWSGIKLHNENNWFKPMQYVNILTMPTFKYFDFLDMTKFTKNYNRNDPTANLSSNTA